MIAIFNFSQHIQSDYAVAVPGIRSAVPLLYSDWEPFGGTTPQTESVHKLKGEELICTLQAFSAILFDVEADKPSDSNYIPSAKARKEGRCFSR